MIRFLLLLAGIAALAPAAHARQATVDLETRILWTYPYGAPDPVPMLARDARLYPYHAYDGYAVTGRDSAWTLVRLENDQVVAWVLPDVGGKIWGAVEKADGTEFIYRNEVMKFRNIALRGPWTSGGVELNFGVIGHAPWTAAPVDYALERTEDGSASVVVGAMDIPSRTQWRVRISVPQEGAFVQTDVLWYNPTPFHQPYYNWMTAAAPARSDLQLVVPGDAYLRHSGEALPWPVDAEGRTLSRYADNTFEGHKSYHVVGAFEDFFGGYYADEDRGFGHWSPYGAMPGQKMWLWALSDEGGIWEDLLTDTDGQYVEWQAGRLFVQYAPGESLNPVTQAAFEPGAADRWTERWFPVRGIGGMSEASDRGVLHVARSGDSLTVGVNAFRRTLDTLVVQVDGRTVLRRPLSLDPLVPGRAVLPSAGPGPVVVTLPALGLRYASDPDSTRLHRPFRTDPEAFASRPEADRLVFAARELARARRTADARDRLRAALERDPWHPEALALLAELDLAGARYEEALASALRLLEMDTYDARSNWLAGLAWQALGRRADAEEAFVWAARSVAWRAAAHTRLAELALAHGEYDRAIGQARFAASHSPDPIGALEIEATALRLLGRLQEAQGVRDRLLQLDPLHHGARAEAWLADPSAAHRQALVEGIRGELPEQAWLEIAAALVRRGRGADAVTILSLAPAHPLVTLWRAWLHRETDPAASTALLDRAAADPPGFVFPFRPESLPVLEWAAGQRDAWRFRYWLALLHWSLDRTDDAARLMRSLGDEPDYGPVYVARAALLAGNGPYEPEPDLRRAVALAPDTWQLPLRLVDHLERHEEWEEALAVAEQASARFPAVFDVSLARARALLQLGRAEEAAAIMDTVVVLPSEMGRTSRRLYEWAHLQLALDHAEGGRTAAARDEIEASLAWPRRLGQGRPYDADERLQQGLLAWLDFREGLETDARARADSVSAWTEAHPDASPVPAALVHALLLRFGRDAAADRIADRIGRAAADPEAARTAAFLGGADPGAEPAATDPGTAILRRALRLTRSGN